MYVKIRKNLKNHTADLANNVEHFVIISRKESCGTIYIFFYHKGAVQIATDHCKLT